MTKSNLHQLDRILNNKTSGSSELVHLLNNYIISIQNNKTEILKTISLVKVELGHFPTVISYLKALKSELNSKVDLIGFLRNQSIQQKEKAEVIFKHIYPRLKYCNSIITLSRSGTVLGVLKLWHQQNKRIRVVICESRPKFEGRLMAESLAKIGVKTELITDAMSGLYVAQVDAALIGADSVFKNGNIINKIGSKSLGLFCKEYKKPLFVVSTKSKFSSSIKFIPKKENPKEIINRRIKNLSVSNIYFEEIEKKFITKIFTD